MPMTVPEAERWLSVRRLDIYLAVTERDIARALRLYAWNAEVTAALLRDIGHLEVLVRNRYDVALTRTAPDWTRPTDPLWSRETGLVQARRAQYESNKKSQSALRYAARSAPRTTHGHIIANLTFGFWAALTRAEREPTIWTPLLSRTFPGQTRGQVHDAMEKLNTFRNRLAHWEPVFSRTTGVMRQLQLLDDMMYRLGPDIHEWVGQQSATVSLLSSLPEPRLLQRSQGTYLGTQLP